MPDVPPVSTLTRSATDFIKSALRLVGALRSGQGLTGDELNDCKTVLNDLLDGWSAKRLTVYVVQRLTLDQNQNTLMLKAGQQTYTLGNLSQLPEDFLMNRPVRLERVSILYSASQSTPVELAMDMYDDVKWQQVANKTSPSILPQVCYVETNFPDLNLSFWPVPTQANPVILYAWLGLTQFPDLTSQWTFPPAYSRALRFALAMDLAAEFPCDMTKLQLVRERAAIYKMEVEALNLPMKEAVCDEAIVGSYGKMGNIFTGSANRSLRN